MVKMILTQPQKGRIWEEMDVGELGASSLEYTYNLHTDTIAVSTREKRQTHIGFGGAFTEACAYTLANTTKENRDEVIKAYFDKECGLSYNMGRVPIHGCDFALEPYTYVKEGDTDLATFDIKREDKWMIPLIKDAESTAGERLKLMCTPWSPPAYMKTNGDINHGGHLLKEYADLWASYLVKYLEEMKKRGIEFAFMSIQNEPEATQEWASLRMSGRQEAEFAVQRLYPKLKEAGFADSVKILGWDHNKDNIYRRFREIMRIDGAQDVFWGAAYHWYVSEKSDNLSMLHMEYPNLHIIFSEGCVEIVNKSGSTSSKLGVGAVRHGEIYAKNIINDFNNYCEGWIDWNMALDERGGPNYVGNYCEAPIMIDRAGGNVMYNWSYYYIGHFSRYIKPGAKRLLCMDDSKREGIYSTAYLNPDGEIVVVVMSEIDYDRRMAVSIDKENIVANIPGHSITTFLVEPRKGQV